MARMVTGRNGASELNRAPKGDNMSSTNCCRLSYVPAAADLPTISQRMSGAKMLVMGAVPAAQAAKASATIWRLSVMMRATSGWSTSDRGGREESGR